MRTLVCVAGLAQGALNLVQARAQRLGPQPPLAPVLCRLLHHLAQCRGLRVGSGARARREGGQAIQLELLLAWRQSTVRWQPNSPAIQLHPASLMHATPHPRVEEVLGVLVLVRDLAAGGVQAHHLHHHNRSVMLIGW